MIYKLSSDNFLKGLEQIAGKDVTLCNRKFFNNVLRRAFTDKNKVCTVFRFPPGMPPQVIENGKIIGWKYWEHIWDRAKLSVLEELIQWDVPIEEILEIKIED